MKPLLQPLGMNMDEKSDNNLVNKSSDKQRVVSNSSDTMALHNNHNESEIQDWKSSLPEETVLLANGGKIVFKIWDKSAINGGSYDDHDRVFYIPRRAQDGTEFINHLSKISSLPFEPKILFSNLRKVYQMQLFDKQVKIIEIYDKDNQLIKKYLVYHSHYTYKREPLIAIFVENDASQRQPWKTIDNNQEHWFISKNMLCKMLGVNIEDIKGYIPKRSKLKSILTTNKKENQRMLDDLNSRIVDLSTWSKLRNHISCRKRLEFEDKERFDVSLSRAFEACQINIIRKYHLTHNIIVHKIDKSNENTFYEISLLLPLEITRPNGEETCVFVSLRRIETNNGAMLDFNYLLMPDQAFCNALLFGGKQINSQYFKNIINKYNQAVTNPSNKINNFNDYSAPVKNHSIGLDVPTQSQCINNESFSIADMDSSKTKSYQIVSKDFFYIGCNGYLVDYPNRKRVLLDAKILGHWSRLSKNKKIEILRKALNNTNNEYLKQFLENECWCSLLEFPKQLDWKNKTKHIICDSVEDVYIFTNENNIDYYQTIMNLLSNTLVSLEEQKIYNAHSDRIEFNKLRFHL